jgi:ankyrin repeat protein
MGAPFDVTNTEGLTPLMCCSQQGHERIAQFIIEHQPQCVFFCNAAGDSALHYAGDSPARSIRHRFFLI